MYLSTLLFQTPATWISWHHIKTARWLVGSTHEAAFILFQSDRGWMEQSALVS